MRKTLIQICFPAIAALVIGACAPAGAGIESEHTATNSHLFRWQIRLIRACCWSPHPWRCSSPRPRGEVVE